MAFGGKRTIVHSLLLNSSSSGGRWICLLAFPVDSSQPATQLRQAHAAHSNHRRTTQHLLPILLTPRALHRGEGAGLSPRHVGCCEAPSPASQAARPQSGDGARRRKRRRAPVFDAAGPSDAGRRSARIPAATRLLRSPVGGHGVLAGPSDCLESRRGRFRRGMLFVPAGT